MKKALATLLDDNFLIGFIGFWKSFIYHNKWFLESGIDLVILDNDLSEESKKTILLFNENAIFRKIKKDRYTKVNFDNTHDKLKATFYKLDVFGILEYDRITFIDSDVTVLGDIKEIFDIHHGFCACSTYAARNDHVNDMAINSGVFTVNKKYINKHTYCDLLKVARRGYSMPDQKTINRYFGGNIHHMPKVYNVEKRMWKTEKHKDIWDKKRILHWVADKPWMSPEEHQNDIEKSFMEIYPIWHKYYNMNYWENIVNG